MSVETTSKRVTKHVLSALVCDRCGKRATPADPDLGMQEFLVFRHVGGYASAWGDGNRVAFELCDACGHELFQSFARVGGPDPEWPCTPRPHFAERLMAIPNVGADSDFSRD